MQTTSQEIRYNKRQLNFRVKEQKIFRDFNNRSLVPGSKGYLEAVFEFDRSWSNLTKFIVFKDENEKEFAFVLEDNRCDVPDEVTDGTKFSLYLVGVGHPNVKVQTAKVMVYQKGGN